MTSRLLIVLFGGMALLLYGMQHTGDGLQRVAGARLRQVLTHLTANRFAALLTGAAATALIQSSTATTIMVIGFVQAGLLSLYQATTFDEALQKVREKYAADKARFRELSGATSQSSSATPPRS